MGESGPAAMVMLAEQCGGRSAMSIVVVPQKGRHRPSAAVGIPVYGSFPSAPTDKRDLRGERDMNLKSGELYFINEVDVLTGVASNFYKIGLVKDSRHGDAANRLDEHQTGNPRKLVIVECVEAVAISDLEKTVHNRFATRRILGEWFVLDAEELSTSIGVAKDLSNEQALHRHQLEASAELSKVESDGSTREPQDEDLEWFVSATSAKALGVRAKALKMRTEMFFKSAIEVGADAGNYARWTQATRRTFDKDKFAESYPDLFEQFLKEETRLSPKFLLKPQKDAETPVLPDSFLVLEQQFEQFFSVDSSDGDALHQLHQLHLQLLRFTAQAKWDQAISEANLKALCGESDGIGELLTWRRKQSTSSKLDETALKSQHPDIYDSFAQEIPNPKFEVVPMRSYA
jgi:hypothetical protein